MDYYSVIVDISSENSQTTPISAGKEQFTLSLQWPTAWQELRDVLVQRIKDNNKSAPLFNRVTGEIVRNYDLLEYCHNLIETDLSTYLEDENNLIPYSVWQLPEYRQLSTFQDFVVSGEALYVENEWMEDHLVWQFKLVDMQGYTYSGPIRKGEWITDAENGLWEVQFRFTPERLARSSTSFELQIGVENGLI